MENLMLIMLAGEAPKGTGMNAQFLIMMVLIIVVFYFFMIRPQSKRQKELRNFRESLKKGDKVLTTGGIYGRITDIDGQIVMIEVDNNVKIKVDKAAVLKDPGDIESK
jgi:preprotein translocase subunit YajC